MQLFLQAEQLHCIEVDETSTCGSLKQVIQAKEGLNINDQVCVYVSGLRTGKNSIILPNLNSKKYFF